MNIPSNQTTGHRSEISLDGVWAFRHGAETDWRDIIVPMPWQAQFADLRQTSGKATYRRGFDRPAGPGAVYLRFGAVSYFATVRVNGQDIGSHEGGYLPFKYLIPAELLHDTNILEVDCLLPDGNPSTTPDFPFAEIPHGKQSWYGPIGGIWQSVQLILRAPCHLQHCAITTGVDGTVTVRLTVPTAALGAAVQITVWGPDGQKTATARQNIAATDQVMIVQVADPALWSNDLERLA